MNYKIYTDIFKMGKAVTIGINSYCNSFFDAFLIKNLTYYMPYNILWTIIYYMAYNITYKLVKIVHICIINFGYILTLDILTLDILTLVILTLVIH